MPTGFKTWIQKLCRVNNRVNNKRPWKRFCIAFFILAQLGLLAVVNGDWAGGQVLDKKSCRGRAGDRGAAITAVEETALFQSLLQVSETDFDRAIIYGWVQVPLPGEPDGGPLGDPINSSNDSQWSKQPKNTQNHWDPREPWNLDASCQEIQELTEIIMELLAAEINKSGPIGLGINPANWKEDPQSVFLAGKLTAIPGPAISNSSVSNSTASDSAVSNSTASNFAETEPAAPHHHRANPASSSPDDGVARSIITTAQGELIKVSARSLGTVSPVYPQEYSESGSFYLIIEADQITSVERAVHLRQIVTRALEEAAKEKPKASPAKTSLNMTFSRPERLAPAAQLKLVNRMLQAVGAGSGQGVKSSELISLTTYTPGLTEYETLAGEPVNLQVASRYHSLDNRTYFHVGAPLLMIEY